MNCELSLLITLFLMHFLKSSDANTNNTMYQQNFQYHNQNSKKQGQNHRERYDHFHNNCFNYWGSVSMGCPQNTYVQQPPVFQYNNPVNGQLIIGEEGFIQSLYRRVSDPNPSHGQGQGHEEMKVTDGHGWGMDKGGQKHIPHKKKKGKKGILSKAINKLKRGKKPSTTVWKEVRECDGYENFIKDLEIISWKLGIWGFIFATISLLLHILNQLYGFFSVVKVGLPERISTFLELIAPNTTPEMIRVALAVVGLLDYFIIFFFSYPLGNIIIAIDLVAEVLTAASLALAAITIFDDIVEEKVWSIFSIDLQDVFDGYACNNPFSKEKQIEQFFESLTEKFAGESHKNKNSNGESAHGWTHVAERRRGQRHDHIGFGWMRI